MSKLGRAGCAISGLLLAFVKLLNVAARFLAALLSFTGLWLPLFYAVLGVVLFLTTGFNPFDWKLEGQLYISGFVACVLCSIAITIRNLIIKPFRSIFPKKKEEPLQRKKRKIKTVEITEYTDRKNEYENAEFSTVPIEREFKTEKLSAEKTPEPPKAEPQIEEKPLVYLSSVENDLLVYEYKDRFELFRVIGDNEVKMERIEFK